MKCQDAQQALDARLNGTAKRAEAEALDAHVASCGDCRARLEDALRLQAELRLIGTEGPSPRGWDGIAARLEADPEFQRLAAASAPAVAGQTSTPAGGTEALVTSIESELELAARHYENAIAGLERVASEGETPLDPAVMATVRENLEIIDQAIDDSRQALRTDPQSQMAQESLFDAFRRKVALLQDTIALMNELRRGAPAQTALGMNKG